MPFDVRHTSLMSVPSAPLGHTPISSKPSGEVHAVPPAANVRTRPERLSGRVVLVLPRDARERRGFPWRARRTSGGVSVSRRWATRGAKFRNWCCCSPATRLIRRTSPSRQHRGTVADALGPSAVRASVRAGRATSVQLQVSQSVPGGQDASVRGITHRGDGGAKPHTARAWKTAGWMPIPRGAPPDPA